MRSLLAFLLACPSTIKGTISAQHISSQLRTSHHPQVFDAARVVRVDPIGLQLALPLGDDGSTCPAYCHVSNVSDERVDKLEKQFKPGPGGSTLRVRVIGFRLVDGLATVSAKKAVVEQQVGHASMHACVIICFAVKGQAAGRGWAKMAVAFGTSPGGGGPPKVLTALQSACALTTLLTFLMPPCSW